MSKEFNRIIWIGTYVDSKCLEILLGSGLYTQGAANRTQDYYIKELSESSQTTVEVFSALVTNTFPNVKELYIKGFEYQTLGKNIHNIGFVNLPIINLISQTLVLRRRIKKWIKNNKNENTLVVVYAMRLPYIFAAKTIKRILPDVCIVNIIPDLPRFMRLSQNRLRKFLVEVNERIIRSAQSCVDGFVLYAKAMAESLQLDLHKCIVIEGIFGADEHILYKERYENNKQVFAYLGNINRQYGVESLVKGFIQAGLENTELHIYGYGGYCEELKQICTEHLNVKYCGSVIPEQAFRIMQRCDVLINPRPSFGEFTKYSCPSKVLEYMASGTPVLMTRLAGIPDEYYKYVFTIEDESVNGIAVALQEFNSLNANERMQKAREAREFILNQKSATAQVNKMLSFAERLMLNKTRTD